MMPRTKHGKWDWLTVPYKVDVSYKSSSMKDVDKHYFTMPREQQKIVDKYLEEIGYKIGKSEFKDGEEIIIEKRSIQYISIA